MLFLIAIPHLGSAYQVCFEGNVSLEIKDAIESISQLLNEKSHPPPTFFTLKKRAESDKKTVIQLLHAFGFYEADVSLIFLGEFPDTTIRLQIFPGIQYCFGPPAIVNEENMSMEFCLSNLSLKGGLPARSDVILESEEKIFETLAANGFPLARILKREVVVDQDSKLVFVKYIVNSGPLAYFGPLCVQGLKKLRPQFVKRRVMWRKGQLYNPHFVECTDTYLQESGLFSYVVILPADTVDPQGNLPMLIQLEEKKFRHIGAGVSYSTDESAGALLQWGHDNLTGWGDAFSFVGEYSEVIKRATFLYGMPDFYGRNQDLLYSLELRREDAPGFIEREASFLVRISRKINNCFSFNYGGRYEKLLSTKSDNDENYNLLSLPVQIRWDTSNRLLSPTSGTTIAYFATPYQAIIGEDIFFFRQELFAATYQPITAKGGILMALSAQLGSIVGQTTLNIPAPKRFYAGSSTSLRGYKYLSVSPLDDRKPLGGRSLMIFQIEPRFRIYWEKLYFATFYDIGNVFDSPFPNFYEKLLRSWGVGIRYLTPVGPFRLDIAFPIDKRKGIDKSFQIYASIGQTF
jgi:translocation and assembly module TamA